jgi:predicted DNA binding CopG/RHH family protein
VATEAQLNANKRYQATQENIVIRVKKGKRDELRLYAGEKGLSLQAYIKKLISADMGGIDL